MSEVVKFKSVPQASGALQQAIAAPVEPLERRAGSAGRHLLLVEDEAELCITLGDRLRRESYDVEFAWDGITAFEKVTQSSFDLILLDIMLPARSGLDVCTDIRSRGIVTPILFLTAKTQTADRIVGLKLGGDDYISKPFDTMELLARMEALLRRPRTAPPIIDSARLQVGTITLNVRRSQVIQDGQVVQLSWKEFQLLSYMAERPDATITREELLSQVWGLKPGTMTRTIDMHVAALRQKLERDPKNPRLIQTVPLLGYRLVSHGVHHD